MEDTHIEGIGLTIDQVAESLQVPRQDLYDLMAAGDGPPVVRVGLRTIVEQHALLQWLETRRQRADGAPVKASRDLEAGGARPAVLQRIG